MLSIVVASRSSEDSPDACLAALRDQCTTGVEVLLAVEDDTGPAGAPTEGTSWYTRIDGHGLVNHLWAAGVQRASGRIVSLLAASVIPDPNWIQRTIAAHGNDIHAIGGPIEPGQGLGIVDWAAYFCRYSAHRAASAIAPRELAGDNVSYLADALHRYADVYRDGFWETFVHDRMRQDGLRLEWIDDRVVRMCPVPSVGSFSRQRYRHGRIFGQMRSHDMPGRAKLTRILASPVVPFLLAARAARPVRGRQGLMTTFIAALPLTLWFFTCWTFGELVGYLRSSEPSSSHV